MRTPHKHAHFIKAWADGESVEYWTDSGWVPIFKGWSWDNILVNEYRIKPEPKPDREVFWKADLKGLYARLGIMGSNLKLTFDGETGDLKKAEVLHGR